MSHKVSCVCCTYGRFNCVERIIQYFLNQTYTNSELVIYNTDIKYPLSLGESLQPHVNRISIFNNGIDSITGEYYTNIGAIRRDALQLASGDYYNCFDDDDIYLPHHLQQCMDGIKRTGRKAFKPKESFFRTQDGKIQIVKNVMEASVVVDIKEVDFNLESGREHLSWYTRLRDSLELNENEEGTVPAYCFDWGFNLLARHKQSGNIDAVNNFEDHKMKSIDHAVRPLEMIDVSSYYQPFYDFVENK